MRLVAAPLVLVLALPLAGDGRAAPGSVVRVEHRDPSALPARGPRTAPVTIELFLTPNSRWRNQVFAALERLQGEHPTRIRLVYRVMSGGGHALLPNAALEAQAQGKFDEFMVEVNALPGTATQPQILALGKKVELDVDRLRAAIEENRYGAVLAANERRLKRRFPPSGPPVPVLFNGKPMSAWAPDSIAKDYKVAYDSALELLDRGADPRVLEAAFDEEMMAAVDEPIVPAGPLDETLDDAPPGERLARPPLDLRDLPSLGPPDAPLAIVIACRPTSASCNPPMNAARGVQELFADSVRVVWAPFFDVTNEEAAEESMLGDAALCAEQLGASAAASDAPASPGWGWVEAVLAEVAARRPRRSPGTSAMIDRIADKLHVDARAFTACRARIAGATIERIEAARRAGMRVSPSTVVGDRIYAPITDRGVLQALVTRELAGGDLDRLQRSIGLDSWHR
jgi:hypothetical protein